MTVVWGTGDGTVGCVSPVFHFLGGGAAIFVRAENRQAIPTGRVQTVPRTAAASQRAARTAYLVKRMLIDMKKHAAPTQGLRRSPVRGGPTKAQRPRHMQPTREGSRPRAKEGRQLS